MYGTRKIMEGKRRREIELCSEEIRRVVGRKNEWYRGEEESEGRMDLKYS